MRHSLLVFISALIFTFTFLPSHAQEGAEGEGEEAAAVEDNSILPSREPPLMPFPDQPPPPPTPEVPAVLYEATWESLDERPVPGWYDRAKIGVMVHYGLYSVIGVGSEWFWWSWKGEKKQPYLKYIGQNFKPSQTYASFTSDFSASFYNPAKWAELFEHAGARYAIITAKYHDGYCMWPSPYSQHWNSIDTGPGRDIVGDFIFGVRQNSNMRAGIQYSMYEWFNPLFLMDKNNNFTTSFFPATKSVPELKDLVERYGPDILWLSGEWDAPDTYWNSTNFLQWLYNESPVRNNIVTNDRWGQGTSCHHGGYLNCGEDFNPKEILERKFETVTSMDRFSWGHRRNAHVWDILKAKDLVKKLVETVSCGGNLLINVGATAEGLINPIFEDRLLEFGRWLDINGEGIYATTPWKLANDTLAPGVWYTKRDDPKGEDGILYALLLKYPVEKITLAAPHPSSDTQVILLGFGEVKWTETEEDGIEIELPPLQALNGPPHGWVLRISRLQNF